MCKIFFLSFFLGGGGGGKKRCIMGEVKMVNDKSASRPSIQTLSQISWKEENPVD